MNNKRSNIILTILLLLVIVALGISIKTCQSNKNKVEDNTRLVNSICDTLRTYRDKNNNLIAQISVIEMQSADAFLKLKTNDSIIEKLQNEVKYYKNKLKDGGTVTIVEVVNHYDTTTLYEYINDTLKFSYMDDWITLYGKGFDNVLDFDLVTYDKYTLAILGKAKKRYVELKCESPYSHVKYLRTYMDELGYKDKKLGIGLNIGPTLGYDFLHKGLYVGLGVSIGLNYNFVEF